MEFTENTELFDIDINHGEGGTKQNRMKSVRVKRCRAFIYALYVEYAVEQIHRMYAG
jgi:hypothetical protein